MHELAASLALYFNASPKDALQMTQSDARAFFDSKAFAKWRENQEAQNKIDVAVIDRLNGVMRGLNIVAKAITRTR